ncbi:MAG: hypothetical protein Q8P28_06400 [Deltaproteobacteria bacterium]|nr:hypothetical protein [Deltaproteobacteria bacterium]
MIYKEFVKKAVRIFTQKKKEKGILKNRVFRGRAATSSSDLENLFAVAIAESIPKQYSILVDYPLSIKKGSMRALTLYPDISIVKGNVLKGVIEFKIDLGYLKKEWINQHKTSIKQLENASILKYKKNVGTIKAKKDCLKISKKLASCVVVLSSENSHNRLDKFKTELKPYILFKRDNDDNGVHPNSSKMESNEIIKKILKGKTDWPEFINYLEVNYP